MISSRTLFSAVLSAAVVAAGCTNSDSPPGAADVAKLKGKYALSAEPEGARGVAAVRGAAGEGDEVVVLGRVGGGKAPFVDGMAAFTIVDPSVEPCRDGCGCPTPWDYCCEPDKLRTHKVTVKLVDEQGNVSSVGARELLGIKELTTLVARGKAKVDEAGNLTVLADGVYVRP